MEATNLAMLARLDRLTRAIGDDGFGRQLLASISALTAADHVMAFAYSSNQPPRVVVNVGTLNDAAAARSATGFASSLYLLDPNYAQLRQTTEGSTSWFPFNAAKAGDHFQEVFYDAAGISDVIAYANRQNDVLFYLLALRGGAQSFADGQRWLLRQLGEVIIANVHKHFAYMYAIKGQNQFVIDRVLAEAPTFSALTPRERRVCLGILTGYTSESIGINLEISVNSVLTYRKRLYDKLDISSQNELFMKVINAMMDLSGSDFALPGHKETRMRPLELERAKRDARFNEYYMAEAFISDDLV